MTERDDFNTPALRLGLPAPSDAAARVARQRELGMAATADSVFDQVARRAADRLRLLKDHFAACAGKAAHARSVDGAQIRNERAFLARLEIAIVRQSEEAQACEQRGEQARAAVNAAERRLRAFGQLQNRADRALALVENKRDQDRNDEFAARRHRDAH